MLYVNEPAVQTLARSHGQAAQDPELEVRWHEQVVEQGETGLQSFSHPVKVSHVLHVMVCAVLLLARTCVLALGIHTVCLQTHCYLAHRLWLPGPSRLLLALRVK